QPVKGVRLGFSISQLCDSAMLGNQDSAVVAFDQRVDSLRWIWHRIELGWTRLPSPQTIHRSRPDIASAILKKGRPSQHQTAVLSIALGVAALNPTKSSRGKRPPGDPYRSFTILKQRFNNLPIQFRVVSQLAVLPACKPAIGANPKTSVARP